MKQHALGLIETYGLVAAIEAADAALKTAAVELVNYEKAAGGGLVTIAVTGEVAAVQAAVTAGSAAAARVGQLVSRHVIPRPLADIRLLIKERNSGPEPAGPDGSCPDPAPPEEKEKDTSQSVGEESGRPQGEREYLETLSVMKLRDLARKTGGIAIQGRQISRANKEQLIFEIMRAKKSE